MSEPELPFDDFAHENGLEDIDYRSEEIDIDSVDSPESLLERLKDIDYKNHAKAAIAVGSAAVVVAGLLAARKKSTGKFFISRGDRHNPHTVSIGEMVQQGAAIALPVSDAAAEELAKGDNYKALFAMGKKGMAYPLKGDAENVRHYTEATKEAAKWLIGLLSTSDKRKSEE